MAKKVKRLPKPCVRCGQDGVIGERYCKGCRSIVLKEMADSGYLQSGDAPRTPSEQLGRGQRSSNICGGSAEMLDDGDD